MPSIPVCLFWYIKYVIIDLFYSFKNAVRKNSSSESISRLYKRLVRMTPPGFVFILTFPLLELKQEGFYWCTFYLGTLSDTILSVGCLSNSLKITACLLKVLDGANFTFTNHNHWQGFSIVWHLWLSVRSPDSTFLRIPFLLSSWICYTLWVRFYKPPRLQF